MPVAGAHTVVMKFGGTSVADAERIKHAARRIVQRAEEGSQVVRAPRWWRCCPRAGSTPTS
jgi:aspartokinase